MIKLAIIEDTLQDAQHISSLVSSYAKAADIQIEQKRFENALKFLDAKEKYDIILLDIMMPGFNGMEMAHRLRKFDEDTVIIFVTSMEQYAIEGYSVSAVGFLIKPAKYEQLRGVLDKAIQIVRQKISATIMVKTYTELISVDVSTIEYAEVKGHSLIFHTQKGEIQTKGTLKELIDKVESYNFIRCNNYAVVNARYIRAVRENTVVLPSAELEISRRKKSEFIEAYLRYSGGLSND